jgi:hypothetical protein
MHCQPRATNRLHVLTKSGINDTWMILEAQFRKEENFRGPQGSGQRLNKEEISNGS